MLPTSNIQHTHAGYFFGTVTSPQRPKPVNTARAIAFTIQELSNVHVLKTNYLFFKKKYGDNAILGKTDTDSLTYLIYTDNLIADFI